MKFSEKNYRQKQQNILENRVFVIKLNFLGMENSYRHKLLYRTKGYVNDYDSAVDPSILNEHSTAAFRYFHSLIAGRLQ